MTLKKSASWTVRVTSLLLIAVFLYTFRHTVLACHDSFNEFIQARTMTFAENFRDALDFCLARGRVGVIFPFFVAVKRFIEGHFGYAGVWLLQQVPIFANVALLAAIIGKRTREFYGWFFASFFVVFLQVDIWHSLIVCYPFDFMYGLFLMILGILTYWKWLCNLGGKNNNWRMVLSCFLYYESMQAYEPFITAAACYALLSLIYVVTHGASQTLIRRFWDFCRRLIPHFIVAVAYYGIIVYLHKHPVTDVVVMPIEEHGSLTNFLITWKSYSLGMFPLKLLPFLGPVKHNFNPTVISFQGVVIAGLAGLFLIALIYLIYNDCTTSAKEDVLSLRKSLLLIGACGLLIAVFYAAPHAFTANYQEWVVKNHAYSYVPTTICYFGWSVFFSCMGGVILSFCTRLSPKLLKAAALLAAFIFAIGGYLTFNINVFFKNLPAATGNYMSVHGQNFYALISSDSVADVKPDLIYVPGFNGIYGRMELNDLIADFELDYDVTLVNDGEQMSVMASGYENPVTYIEDIDGAAGVMVTVDDYSLPEEQWTTSQDIFVVAPYGGDIVLSYSLADGTQLASEITVSGGEGINVPPDDSIIVNSINVTR